MAGFSRFRLSAGYRRLVCLSFLKSRSCPFLLQSSLLLRFLICCCLLLYMRVTYSLRGMLHGLPAATHTASIYIRSLQTISRRLHVLQCKMRMLDLESFTACSHDYLTPSPVCSIAIYRSRSRLINHRKMFSDRCESPTVILVCSSSAMQMLFTLSEIVSLALRISHSKPQLTSPAA